MVKNSKRIIAIILALTLSLGFSSCGKEGSGGNQNTKTSQEQAKNDKNTSIKVVDIDNKTVEFNKPVEKIANNWPSSATMMICLGAGDKLASVHKVAKLYPLNSLIYPKLSSVPVISDNPEEVVKSDPDVVITSNKKDSDKYSNAGLKSVDLMFNNYESMKKSLKISGEMIGSPYKEKAEKLTKYIDQNIDTVSKTLKSIKENEKPLVYYVTKDMYKSTGKGTIMEEWVKYGGGRYATSDIGTGMRVEVNKESILKKNPDIIFVGGGEGSKELVEKFKNSPEWKDINAVKNNNIHIIPQGCFGWDRFGAESSLQILWSANKIHPGLVKIDMKEEARKFYKDYANFDITDSQLDSVMNGSSDVK